MQLTSPNGHPLTTRTSATDNTATLVPWDVATLADLKAIEDGRTTTNACGMLPRGREEFVRSLSRSFLYSPASALTADDQLVVRPDDRTALQSGRWLAKPGQIVDLEFDFDKDTADGATLYTVPTGANLMVLRGYWEITTGFTGGSSSAIGVDSDLAPHTTAGDLLGGSGGDVAATLVEGNYILGTVGADQAAGIILTAGKLVRFQRITSAFTEGAGKVHLVCALLTNDVA
jgi:hypothetical protein